MSLKEQMLKAGLITEQDVKRATHKEKVVNKETGRRERERQQEEKRRKLESERQAEQAKDRDREQERGAKRGQVEAERQSDQRQRSAISAPYSEGLIEKWGGPRRYYFVQEGRVDFLMVTEEIARRLEQGQVAIVGAEKNPRRPVLLNAGAAKKLKEIAPERLYAFHGA